MNLENLLWQTFFVHNMHWVHYRLALVDDSNRIVEFTNPNVQEHFSRIHFDCFRAFR